MKTLRKRQSSLPIKTAFFWGSGWGHGGPALVALTSPISCNFFGRCNQNKPSFNNNNKLFFWYISWTLPETGIMRWNVQIMMFWVMIPGKCQQLEGTCCLHLQEQRLVCVWKITLVKTSIFLTLEKNCYLILNQHVSWSYTCRMVSGSL